MEVLNTYDLWADRMANYPNTAERMCENYYHLFVNMVDKRDEFLKLRKEHKETNLSKFSQSLLRLFQKRN